MGVPFLAVRGLLHSDILKYRPDLLVRENPFNPGEQIVLAQAIRPDVAVFHALKADRWGNAIIPGHRDDLMMARAARRVVVTAEEIVEDELQSGEAGGDTFLPAIDGCRRARPLRHIRVDSACCMSETRRIFANIFRQQIY